LNDIGFDLEIREFVTKALGLDPQCLSFLLPIPNFLLE
jgi:hypothetical protein